MTFVPVRLAGDRITLKDGSHWTIRECFGRTGIDDYYDVDNGERSRFVYADEIASPAPIMRGLQSMGRALRPVPPTPEVIDHADDAAHWQLAGRAKRPSLAEWTRRYDAARTGPSVDELIAGGFLQPYQSAAFAALDPETNSFELTPNLGKVHYVGGDYNAEELRRKMERDLLMDGSTTIIFEMIDRDKEPGK